MLAERLTPSRAASNRTAPQSTLPRWSPSLYGVAIFSVIAGIMLVSLLPRVETDFWWHVKVGSYIVAHRAVPSRDFFTFSFAGHPWTDHEWLAEICMYLLYRAAGAWGPIVFYASAVAAAFGVLYATMRAHGTNRILALFLTVLAFTVSRGSVGPRVQMLSLLFVALYLWLLTRYGQTNDRRYLMFFPPLMVLWANLHGGFVLGLVVLGIAVAGSVLNCWSGVSDGLGGATSRPLAVTLGFTMAATIVNPNGIRQLLYPLTFVLPNQYTNLIQESASPNFHLWIMMLFEGMLLLLIASIAIARPRLNWTHLLFILAFTHLALGQVRNVPLWAIVVTPFLAQYLAQAASELASHLPLRPYERRPVRGRLAAGLNVTLLLMIVLVYALETHTYITPQALRQEESKSFPVGAVAYLEHHHLPSHVFTSYAWGGYLLWNLYPGYRDYMDSRADTVFDTRILDDYLTMYNAQPGWQRAMARYHVQVVMIERDAPLVQWLARDHAWQLRYRDAHAIIYSLRPA